MNQNYRIERDSMGELQVPADALYAAQTQRAINNFPVSGLQLPASFIRAVALLKRCAAAVNAELGVIDREVADAIRAAAQEVIEGKYPDQFPVDVFQTCSVTSTYMNVNEVLATLASRRCGGTVSANDHVNMGQSSNDVIPTAIHVSAALAVNEQLIPALEHLAATLRYKGQALEDVVKTGRTHLMDAMPIRLQQELDGWALQIDNGVARLRASLPRVYRLAQGGTAVGTGINAHPEFASRMAEALADATGLPFQPNVSFFESLSCQDAAVELSGQMKTIAVGIMKIANDLRWMNSGPLAGLAEIELPALQPGSSIMPGKVNPVIPEVVNQTSFLVIGMDLTVTLAASAGQLQLNVMEPVITFALFASISTMERAVDSLRVNCVDGITANADRTREMVLNSLGIVTVLKPSLGYKQCAEIAREGYLTGKSLHDIVVKEKKLLTQEKWDEVFSFENLISPKFEQ